MCTGGGALRGALYVAQRGDPLVAHRSLGANSRLEEHAGWGRAPWCGGRRRRRCGAKRIVWGGGKRGGYANATKPPSELRSVRKR
jgi:hypothetical protein